MFVSKTTEKSVKALYGNSSFEITKEVALDREFLDFLCLNFPKADIKILSGYDNTQLYSAFDTLYTTEETKVLAENANYVQEKYGKTLTFDEGFSVHQAIVASRKIDNIVSEIKNTKLNGEELSPFEKFMLAYRFVTERLYKEVEPGEELSKSRNLISILNGDKVVCVGYANLLATVLNRLDIPCTTQCLVSFDETAKAYGNHATCLVRMKDEKYNLDGIYFSDPTADSILHKNLYYGDNSFNTALVRLEDIRKTFSKPIILNHGLFETGIRNIKTAKEYSIEIPPILSYLFPEKTGGLAQNNLIKQQINAEVLNSNTPEVIDETISSLSTESIGLALEDYVSYSLSPRRLVAFCKMGSLDTHLNSLANRLFAFGFSKEEAIEIINSHYSENNIKAFLIDEFNNSKNLETEILNMSKNISVQVQLLLKSLLAQNPQKPKTSPDALFESIFKDFSNFAVGRMFFDDEELSGDYAGKLSLLLKQGFTLHEIKLRLRAMAENYDYSTAYLEYKPKLADYAGVNERELYSGAYPVFGHIYNEPYQAEFDTLSKKARKVTQKDYLDAGTAYFLSQGFDETKAKHFARVMLQRTQISSPEGLS